MNKLSYKIILIILSGIIIVSSVTAIFVIMGSKRLMEQEARDKLQYLVDTHTEAFNSELREVEFLQNQLNRYINSTFSMKELNRDPNYMSKYKRSLEPIVRNLAQEATVTKSVYVFFKPELDGKANDVWFADLDNNGVVEREDEFPIEFYQSYSAEKDWFFKPIEERSPIWSLPYVGNVDADKHIIYISYTAPIYVDGEIIGVAGADYHFNLMKERIGNISVYNTGYATLLSDTGQFLIHPDIEEGTYLNTIYNGDYAWLEEEVLSHDQGYLEYTWVDGNDKILNYKALANGWVLGIMPIKDEVFAGIKQLRQLVIAWTGLGALLAGVIGLILSKQISDPIKNIIFDINEIAKGNYDHEIKSTHRKHMDEVGILINAVESMRIRQKKSFEEINEHARELENRVEERTKELITTNDYLENSMALLEEKQAELLISNDQLEESLETLRKTQKELIESEKIAALGYLVAGIAHEMNTPIGNSITLSTHLDKQTRNIVDKLELSDLRKGDLVEYLETISSSNDIIMKNLNSAKRLVNQFKELAIYETKKSQSNINIKDYVILVINNLQANGLLEKILIDVNCDPNLEVSLDPNKLTQICTNLISNSLIYAFEEGVEGHIQIDIEKKENQLFCVYSDDGAGIDNTHLSQIFMPYFSTRFGSKTIGLGLYMVYNVITGLYNGTIRCESELGEGTTFYIMMNLEGE